MTTLRAVFLSTSDRHSLIAKPIVHINTLMQPIDENDEDGEMYPEHDYFILTHDHDLAHVGSNYVHERVGCFLGLIGEGEDAEVLRERGHDILAHHHGSELRAN